MSPHPQLTGLEGPPVEACDRCGIVPAECYLEWSPPYLGVICDGIYCYYCEGIFLAREIDGLVIIHKREKASDY
jgi:hypothetical protein